MGLGNDERKGKFVETYKKMRQVDGVLDKANSIIKFCDGGCSQRSRKQHRLDYLQQIIKEQR